MSFLTPTILSAVIGGAIVGYIARYIIGLEKRNSVELKIKQLLLDAKSEAQKTVDEAKTKANETLEQAKREEKEREGTLRTCNDCGS